MRERKVELICSPQLEIPSSISISIRVMRLNKKISVYATSVQEEMAIGWLDLSILSPASASTALKPKEGFLDRIVWYNAKLARESKRNSGRRKRAGQKMDIVSSQSRYSVLVFQSMLDIS